MRKIVLTWILAAIVCLIATGCQQQSASAITVSETENESVVITARASLESASEEELAVEEESVSFEKEIETFADQVKAAIRAKDMKALEPLLSYPTYIAHTGTELIIVNNSEEFFALSPTQVFDDDLVATISRVDTSALEMVEAGVVMGSGNFNITFNALEGNSYGITGINE